MIRIVGSLCQGDKVRTKIPHCLLKSALHGAVCSRSKEAGVVNSGTVLKQLLEAVDTTDKFHELGNTRVTEASFLALCSEEMELKIANMGHRHGNTSLLELVVVLEFRREGGRIIVTHRLLNHVASTSLEGSVKHVKVEEVLDGAGLILEGKRLLHVT